MALPLAIAVGSALVSAYGQYKSAKAQAEAQRKQAEIGFLRASEVLHRNEINNSLLQESALVQGGLQTVQGFGSGRTAASTAGLVHDTMKSAAKQIEMNNRTAEWEANMARIGAESQMESAGQIQSAGAVQAIGTAGFGVANAFENSPGSEKTADTSSKK